MHHARMSTLIPSKTSWVLFQYRCQKKKQALDWLTLAEYNGSTGDGCQSGLESVDEKYIPECEPRRWAVSVQTFRRRP